MWDSILEAIREVTGQPYRHIAEPQAVSGGCINESWLLKVESASGLLARYFVKVNAAAFIDQFSAEAEGLDALLGAGAIRVPHPVCRGIAGDVGFLVLEYIELGGDPTREREELMGKQLAHLHGTFAVDGRHGWSRDNAIGATPQVNTSTSDWCEFFTEYRLRFQFELARRNGCSFQSVDTFLGDVVPAILRGHQPQASLLHGDLWRGNIGYDDAGNPVIFDPAVYFGDRETDIAFTRMFGGFGPAFYRGYQQDGINL